MEVAGYVVRYGNCLRSQHNERGAAEQWATRCGGVVRPLYDLTDEERSAALEVSTKRTEGGERKCPTSNT